MDKNYKGINNEVGLDHYGMPRRSGRYPWGSGEDPNQHGDTSFLEAFNDLKHKNYSEKEIADSFGMSIREMREKKTREIEQVRKGNIAQAIKLRDKGYSPTEIGRKMGGFSESTIRGWLKETTIQRVQVTDKVADILRDNIDKYGYLDVGSGAEIYLGVNRSQFLVAVSKLKEEGYTYTKHKVKQLGTNKETNLTILSKPKPDLTDVEKWVDVEKHKADVQLAGGVYTEDKGRTWLNIERPVSVDSKRVHIRYAEEGGIDRDGVIQIKPGVVDLSLGNAKYAQVRVDVDDKYYLKGMAVYGKPEEFPPGTDIIFNTNKHVGAPMSKVFKEMKKLKDGSVNWENPFGATIKNEEDLIKVQKHYIDPKTGEKKLSALNIVYEEGNWGEWSKNLASQMLSKQPAKLVKQQLDLMYKSYEDEFEDISKITNPTVKKALLKDFADNCDSEAVHLRAASFPRQAYYTILPVPELSDKQIYAPKYKNGETLVLIRYPHGGIFEIPELTVNNNCKAAKAFMQNAEDALGINPKVAEQLSGADFDGDTVIAIPNNKHEIVTDTVKKELRDFDPKESYPAVPGMKYMSKTLQPGFGHEQKEMGSISNLITDMTLSGATIDEVIRAVRYSMVVIDAAKHKLNYQQAYLDHNIAELKEKYQGGKNRGASTIISRAKAEQRVDERKDNYKIDPLTGKKIYELTNKTHYKKGPNGESLQVRNQQKSSRMFETDDAFTLVRDPKNLVETTYATHANKVKALADKARLSFLNTAEIPTSKEAKIKYAPEVESLISKLNESTMNSPKERKAQLIANKQLKSMLKDNPDLYNDKEDYKRVKNQLLAGARRRVGANSKKIDITDEEWVAIQAGALSKDKLNKILLHADGDRIRDLATPKEMSTIHGAKLSRAKALLKAGYTYSEISDQLGVSASLITKSLKGGE